MSRQARLGLLIIAGLATIIAALFVIAGQKNLFGSTYTVNARFGQVAGLQTGASVLYNGIGVGRVDEVRLPSRPGDPILVRMAINEDARPLIRQDSRAVIQTDGLVGNVIVSLTGGTLAAATVEEGGFITGQDPFDLSQISDRLFTSVSRFDSVTVALTGIITDTRSGEGTLGRFLYDDQLYDATVATTEEFQVALRGFSGRTDDLLLVAENASASIDAILGKVNSGNGTAALLLNDDAIYQTFLTTAAQLQQGAAQLQTVATDVRAITDRFNQAAGWASLGAFRFSENMEALKHNFLFRGYFEDRGYYEMAPFEVREEAIAQTLADLQTWERRLVQQQQEVEAARTEMLRLQGELERRGVSTPDVNAPALPPAPRAPALQPTPSPAPQTPVPAGGQ